MASMKIELPDQLADDRVTVRPMRSEDAAAYAAAFRDDPDLGRLVGVKEDPDEQTVRKQVERQAQRAEDGKGVELAIADPATDVFWGSVILHSFDWESRRCEVGFWVIPSVRGRGVASRLAHCQGTGQAVHAGATPSSRFPCPTRYRHRRDLDRQASSVSHRG